MEAWEDRVEMWEGATSAQCNQPTSTPVAANQAAERLRVQELLRYFQPPDPTIKKGNPRVALDTSLTAYAQLSALRLNCQRSFISLIDHEKQYIIAEATKSVSLETGSSGGVEDDALYLGATTIDIHFGICPDTISFFTSTDDCQSLAGQYVKASRSYYIVNDLLRAPGFQDRPYVSGWPHMRYYAEVPIHSPSGLTIGSLCVVDNKPRDGLDMAGIQALKEISHAVMNHLELVMSKVQRRRAERMIQGLGLFVDGSDSLRDWWMESENTSRSFNPQRIRLNIDELADREFGLRRSSKTDFQESKFVSSDQDSSNSGTVSMKYSHADGILNGRSSHSLTQPIEMLHGPKSSASTNVQSMTTDLQISTISDIDQAAEHSASTTVNDSSDRKSGKDSPSSTTSASIPHGLQRNKPRSDHKKMLSRAANLIREAVGFDGVAFLNPRLGNGRYQALGKDHTMREIGRLSNVIAGSSTELHHDSQLLSGVLNGLEESSAPVPDQPCKVLAFSTRTDPGLDEASSYLLNLSEDVLHRIIQMFPRGCVLKYDDDGLVSTSALELAWYNHSPKAQEDVEAADKQQNCSSGFPMRGVIEAQELHRFFPDARSMILFPLWDSSRGKLYAYNIAWTSDINRVFEREDFAYLASFGNSIMTEFSRLNTIAADRAKADFISSISHELRSPLHGILASAELLKALIKDGTSIEIINTIETCGSTLLDTMENLLTFSKINNLAVKQDQKKSAAKSVPLAQGSVPPPKSLTSEVNLGLLVEEVMTTKISGHQFLMALEASSSQSIRHSTALDSDKSANGVTVICDIDCQLKWFFNTQPGGWKRIVMNLFGNSLKYTNAGFIHVKLSQDEDALSGSHPYMVPVRLTVEDSGKGISEDYLKHHLFTPFQQEDPLCAGTGLGLSIVNQLVKAINGTIEITSEVGLGTKVTVTAMLESAPDSTETATYPIMSQEDLSKLAGRKVGLVGLDAYPDVSENSNSVLNAEIKQSLLIKSSLIRSMRDNFDLNLLMFGYEDTEISEVDILVTNEAHFRSTALAAIRPNEMPLIVLSANLTLDYRPVSHMHGPVVYLSQPFGPQLLARALKSCIPFLSAASGRQHYLNPVSKDLSAHVGSSYNYIWPFQQLTEVQLTLDQTANHSLKDKNGQRDGPRVLLVEDNPINLKLLVTFMERLGHPYVTATDGLEAVRAYQAANGKFDIIFMDIQMPNMDGMLASSEIRKFEQRSMLNRAIIVALTGLASKDAQEQAMISGIDLFLTKPVPLRSLEALIDERFPAPNGASE